MLYFKRVQTARVTFSIEVILAAYGEICVFATLTDRVLGYNPLLHFREMHRLIHILL
jgi:hypothetical protein